MIANPIVKYLCLISCLVLLTQTFMFSIMEVMKAESISGERRCDHGVRNNNGTDKTNGRKARKENNVKDQTFITVAEVAEMMGISKSYAYKIVHKLNEDLKAMGYLTIAGRVNRSYFLEKTCYSPGRSQQLSQISGGQIA